jgi:SAM-dependent methyltransferase
VINLSTIDECYQRIYDRLCGVHPRIRCWHFQWLAVKDLYKDLRRVLRDVRGRILDVGCGEKPYVPWMINVDPSKVVGADIVPGRNVDVVVETGMHWGFGNNSFNAVLCTQVLEHAENPEETLSEIHRVLSPDGMLIATFPFLYGEHGAPRDYRRLSVHGAVRLLESRFEIMELSRQGGIGSTTGLLFLGWLNEVSGRSRVLRLLRPILILPRVVFTLAINIVGWFLDRLDRTGAYYSNVLVVARKHPE